MPKQIPDFEKEYIKGLRKNDLDVLGLLDKRDKDLLKKISNFSKKHGFKEKEVVLQIKEDKYLRSVFSKDPGKQKLHENIAAKFIESLSSVKSFRQLNHSELFIVKGGVIPKKELIKQGSHKSAKTIDFEWETKNKKIYASHKYTKEGGGAQDNQYKDLQEFISESNQSNLQNTLFLAIADGAYYQTRDAGAGIKKIDYLKRLANKHNTFALNINELEEFLVKQR